MEEVKDPDHFFQGLQKSGVVDVNDTHNLSTTLCIQQFTILIKKKRQMMLCMKFEVIPFSCFQVIKT